MNKNLVIIKRGVSNYLETAMKLQHNTNPLGDFSDVIGQEVVEFSLTLLPNKLPEYKLVLQVKDDTLSLSDLVDEMDKIEITKKFLDNVGREGLEITYGTEKHTM